MYYNNYPSIYSSIQIPRTRNYINPINGRKPLTIRSTIGSLEKGIDTISSMIPLYEKAKPIFTQGKTIFSTVKQFFIKKEVKENTPKEKVEVEVVNKNLDESKENETYFDYRQNETNTKPFF